MSAVREGTLSLELTPVFMGSAYKNKGVQRLLDAVTLLPARAERGQEQGRRPRPRRGRDRDRRRPGQAARRARVQARRRPLRPAHVHPRLPGHAREGRDDHQHAHQEEAQGRPARAHARRQDGRHRPLDGRRHRRAVRHRVRLRRYLHGAGLQRRDVEHVRAQARHLARDQAEGQQGVGQHDARRSRASCARTRPSAPPSTRTRTRPSSPAWASCTSTCTSSA